MPLLLLLSFGSGVAALIYEIVWFQLLELVIGSSAVSLGVLLATFMGGTCIGSLMLPRFVSPKYHPLRVYAAIEIGIGVLGLLVLLLMPYVGGIYTAWSGFGLRSFLLRGVVAAVCLLPPTLLMGATLPALARAVAAADGLGFVYGANIAGAVCGCLLSGFYLLRLYDVATATFFAVAINIALAICGSLPAPLRSRFGVGEEEEHAAGTEPRASASGQIYVAVALSGFCALAAEAVWTRMLGLLLGASVYTLSIVLAVFLTGLGIGSGIGALLCRKLARPRDALGWCQLLAAAAIAWTAYTLGASLPYWPINPAISTDMWFNFQLDLARAFWALLPPTLLWGASFPLALAAASVGGRAPQPARDPLVAQTADPSRAGPGAPRGPGGPPSIDAARLMAGVYAANTAGAIAGALGASLFLVSRVGSQGTEQVLVALSAISGLLLLPRRWIVAPLCAILIYSVPPIAKVLIAYGRYAVTWVGKSDIPYAKEGINSSVAVSKFANGAVTFHVAGKIQASNVPRDMRLQRMLGHLTSLTPANPRSVLVIGCGAGITAGAVSIDPRVEHVTILEIEPLVPEAASDYFSKQNFDVIHNTKVEVRIDDGRHFLLTTKEKFDAITVDPLDPWVKGAANLYTKEFYEVAKQHLNPGGVVTMYIQLFETNVDAVKSSVATFFEVFPNGTIWGNTYEGRGHDMVLLGQVEPARIDLDEMELRFQPVAESLAEVGMNSALDLFATYAGRKSELTEWLKDAAINRDRNLRMQYLAGFGMNLDDSAAIYAGMLAYRRFPADLFTSAEGQVDLLRQALN